MTDTLDPDAVAPAVASLDTIVSLSKRRGFIFPSSEIYGGLNGAWDYGPLGVELKRNIKQAWWDDMITRHDELESPAGAPSAFSMVGLDSALLMNPRVWEASGHVGGFNDPMVDDRETKVRYRADQLAVFALAVRKRDGSDGILDDVLFATPGEAGKTAPAELMAPHRKQIERLLRAHPEVESHSVAPRTEALRDDGLRARIWAPQASAPGTLTAPRAFNLMFKTHVGALEDSTSIAYLRPETAQGIFVNFKNVVDTSRVRLPFGIGQIGKAFRNEINPRNFTFRSREFEQAELEFFCHPSEREKWFAHWLEERLRFHRELGFDADHLRTRPHEPRELAHYAKQAVDIEFRFPFGWQEIEGVHDRGSYDLRQHAEFSGKDLSVLDEVTKERFVPAVIETSVGVDRTALALLCNGYAEEKLPDGETRLVLRLPASVAPIRVAMLPLSKKLAEPAQRIARDLRRSWNTFYDESGNIGRRYRRQDEAGTPYCVTYDFESETDQQVTVRERDSMNQARVPLAGLAAYLRERLSP